MGRGLGGRGGGGLIVEMNTGRRTQRTRCGLGGSYNERLGSPNETNVRKTTSISNVSTQKLQGYLAFSFNLAYLFWGDVTPYKVGKTAILSYKNKFRGREINRQNRVGIKQEYKKRTDF